MKFENVYFVNGTAYAGKSTLVKALAEKYHGIACEENYHNALLDELDKEQFPNLCYTRDLEDWHDFVRRTPDEYEAWINGVSKECEILELQILEELCQRGQRREDCCQGDRYQNVQCPNGRPIFVDTNVSLETLWQVSDRDNVLIMLADPDISVNLFFNRPDREKQFLYRLMLEEKDPEAALENFRQCLARINSQEKYDEFLHSGFRVILRDENRTVEETVALAENMLGLGAKRMT